MEEMLDREGSKDNSNYDPDPTGEAIEHEQDESEEEPKEEEANHDGTSGQEGEASAYPSEQDNDVDEEAADNVA